MSILEVETIDPVEAAAEEADTVAVAVATMETEVIATTVDTFPKATVLVHTDEPWTLVEKAETTDALTITVIDDVANAAKEGVTTTPSVVSTPGDVPSDEENVDKANAIESTDDFEVITPPPIDFVAEPTDAKENPVPERKKRPSPNKDEEEASVHKRVAVLALQEDNATSVVA